MAKIPDERAVPAPRGPFHRPLRIHDVPEKIGLDRHIEATAEECVAIAVDANLPAVASLQADLHIAHRADGRFEVTGLVESTLTQICVVSLEPFESTLRQPVDVSFALPPSSSGRVVSVRDVHAAAIVDVDVDDDPPDPIIGNTIDLGAVALEFLTLARDLYPKKPGVHFSDLVVGEESEPEPSPFAALGRIKDQT